MLKRTVRKSIEPPAPAQLEYILDNKEALDELEEYTPTKEKSLFTKACRSIA
jgi:hypothetical protein